MWLVGVNRKKLSGLTQLTRFSCKNNPLNLADPETEARYEAVKTIVGLWPKFIGL